MLDNIRIGAPLLFIQDDFTNGVDPEQWAFLSDRPGSPDCPSRDGDGTVQISQSGTGIQTAPLDFTVKPVTLVSESLEDGIPSGKPWTTVSGAEQAEVCGTGMLFTGTEERVMSLNPFKVGMFTTLSFDLGIGLTGCDAPETVNGESITLEYSTDFGDSWNVMETYGTSSSLQSLSLELKDYPESLSDATMFRWHQAKFSNRIANSDVWSLQNVQMMDIPLFDRYLQMEITTRCGSDALNLPEIRVQYRTTSTSNLFTVARLPSLVQPWSVVTIPLGSEFSTVRRYQIASDNSDMDFGLSSIVIAGSCPHMCNGNGQCLPSGDCYCHEGWGTEDCSVAVDRSLALPQSFTTNFDPGDPLGSLPAVAVAYSDVESDNSSPCLADGLQFGGPSEGHFVFRFDSRFVSNITFTVKACNQAFQQTLKLEFSTNGGANYEEIFSLAGSSFFENIAPMAVTLPDEAKYAVTYFRFVFQSTRSNYESALANVQALSPCSDMPCDSSTEVCIDAGECECAPGFVFDVSTRACVQGTAIKSLNWSLTVVIDVNCQDRTCPQPNDPCSVSDCRGGCRTVELPDFARCSDGDARTEKGEQYSLKTCDLL